LATFARGCVDATVRLYDSVTGKEKIRMIVGDKAQRQHPLALTFGADDKTLYVLANQKPGVMVFDTNTGRLAQTLEFPKDVVPNTPSRLALSQKSHLLAARKIDGVVIWDLTTGKIRHQVESGLLGLHCGAFSPDAGLFAVGGDGKDIVLIDIATGKERRRLPAHSGRLSMVFAPDGKTIAAADHGGCIDQWDVATGKLRPTSPEPNGHWQMGFVNNGREILITGQSVAWWDVTSGKLVRRVPRDPDWSLYPSISPNGKLMAACLLSGDLVLIDADSGRQVRTLPGHKSHPVMTAFSPDGTKLFSAGGKDPRVIIWDVATGEQLHALQGNTNGAYTIAVSPNGRWLALDQGYSDIRIWEVATGRLAHRLAHGHGIVNSIVFSADSSCLVSAGRDEGQPRNPGEVRLWDVATGKEVLAFTRYTDYVWCVAMSADGRMLATSDGDNTLRLWEVASGKERGRIIGHESAVHSLDFSPDGRLLAAASYDAPVYLWDVYASKEPTLAGAKLAKEGRDKLWQSLADAVGAAGFQAVCELIARPSEAVALLEENWKRATPKQAREWVNDLGSEQFSVRKIATAELERCAAEHEDLLLEALQRAGTLEVRRRLEQILRRLSQRPVRPTRMLEVLEQLRTESARQFLQALAEQKVATPVSREAAASLKRLERQK
jgi:WD40 repeat protein